MEPDRNKSWSYTLRFITQDRAFLVILTAAALICLLAAIMPHDPNHFGLPEKTFYRNKMWWQGQANIVLGGDSRICLGLCPETITDVLASGKTLNQGFNGVGYSEEYMDHLVKTLNPDALRKVIILGIGPHQLTKGALAVNGFNQYLFNPANRSSLGEFLSRRYPDLVRSFRSLSIEQLTNTSFNCRYEWNPDGWCAADPIKETPYGGETIVKRWFRDNRPQPEITDRLLGRVRDWTTQNIEVYAFRPPRSERCNKLIQELSQFNQQGFIDRFTAAGGYWIEIDSSNYHTYDGMHLSREQAHKLSAEVARSIEQIRIATKSIPSATDLAN